MDISTIRNIEIDIMQANEIIEGFELAQKNKIPTVVVHHDLITDAMRVRSIKQGKFKILTPIDWPKGESSGMHKLHSMKIDALNTDGFEILLSPLQNPSDIRKEIRTLSDFIRNHLSPVMEIRYVLGAFMREQSMIDMIADTLKECPAPAMLRNDHHTKAQQNKANIKVHQALIEDIRKFTNCSVKISGNVTLKTVMNCTAAAIFGVNLKQAQSIIKETKQDPAKLQQSLASITDSE